MTVAFPQPPVSGTSSFWLTKSVAKGHGMDEWGQVSVGKDIFVISRPGLKTTEKVPTAGFDAARAFAAERAAKDIQGCAQGVLRARDGAYYVASLGLKYQSGNYAAKIEDMGGNSAPVWLRTAQKDLKAVVGVNNWIDFTGNPKPNPSGGLRELNFGFAKLKVK